MSNPLTKLPPHSMEAELSILGSCLLTETAVFTAGEKLKPDDFYLPKHMAIFGAMCELMLEGTPIDLVTVSDRLKKTGEIKNDEDFKYLSDLTHTVPSTANLESYIEIVLQKSALRRLISAAGKMMKDAYDDESKAEDILNSAGSSIYEIAVNERDSIKHIKDVLTQSYSLVGKIAQSEDGLLGLPTGFPYLDRMLSGLQPSQLIVIAGRPGMGKTSFGMQIIKHIGIKKKTPALVFSLEMSYEQLGLRLMCAQAGVPLHKIQSGKTSDEEFDKLLVAMDEMASAPIYFDDTPNITVMQILAKARKLKMEKGLGIIMIDYLQLMSSPSRTENRQLEISELTRTIKVAARELNVPIILLSQLSRSNEKTQSGEKVRQPRLSDLRDSGSIEQDADVVILLHRDSYYTKEPDNTSDVIVAKQRMGATGPVKMVWQGEHTRFLELDKQFEAFDA